MPSSERTTLNDYPYYPHLVPGTLFFVGGDFFAVETKHMLDVTFRAVTCWQTVNRKADIAALGTLEPLYNQTVALILTVTSNRNHPFIIESPE